MANSGSKKPDKHDHFFHVPEPLEKLFGELDALGKVAGGSGPEDVARVRAMLRDALAAQARGETARAVTSITDAMRALAAFAARVDPKEAEEMSAVAEQFGRALLRGDAAEATGAADAMRTRAGAKVIKRD